MGDLLENFKAKLPSLETVWRWLTATDQRTWIGHGAQGLLFGCLAFIQPGCGIIATLFTFGHREADDYLNAINRKSKLRDCFMDLWSPVAGAMVMEAVAAVVR